MYLVSRSLSQPFHIVPQTGDVANLEARKSWERITMCFIIRFTRFLHCDCCHTVPLDKFHVFVGTECRPDSFLVSAKFHRFSIDCKGRKRGYLQRSESSLASNIVESLDLRWGVNPLIEVNLKSHHRIQTFLMLRFNSKPWQSIHCEKALRLKII